MGYIDANLLPDETVVHQSDASLADLREGHRRCSTWRRPARGRADDRSDCRSYWCGDVTAGADRVPDVGVRRHGQRVIVKVGLVQRQTLELLLRQVEAISVDQSIMGRIFNYGSVTLSGTGGVRGVFHNIAAPLEFRRKIQSQTA